MIASMVHLLMQTITAAVAATGRPVMTLFAVQALVGAAVRAQVAEVHGALEPMVSFLAIALMGVFALVEGVLQHQSESAELLDDVYAQRFAGGASAATSALLLGSVGMHGAGAPTGEIWEVIRLANESTHGPLITFGAVLLSLGISLGLGWVRSLVLESLRDAELDGVFQWLETGGVVTVLILLPLLPALALALVLVAAAGMTAVAVLAKGGEWAMDRQSRRPCPSCTTAIRVEASTCPECGESVPVAFSLATSLAEEPDAVPA